MKEAYKEVILLLTKEEKGMRKEQIEESKGEEEEKYWMKMVELPTFEGFDPIGWITRAKKFFEIQNISSKKNIHLAFIIWNEGPTIGIDFVKGRLRILLGRI